MEMSEDWIPLIFGFEDHEFRRTENRWGTWGLSKTCLKLLILSRILWSPCSKSPTLIVKEKRYICKHKTCQIWQCSFSRWLRIINWFSLQACQTVVADLGFRVGHIVSLYWVRIWSLIQFSWFLLQSEFFLGHALAT